MNRVGASQTGELGRSEFEKGAETKVDQVIPVDVKAFAASVASGKPVVKVAGRAKATVALRALARRFAGGRAKKAKLPSWHRLFRGGR
jgi:Flp pilus assembly CpaE family ATPase